MSPIEARQRLSRKNVDLLRKSLEGGRELFEGRACIYATGSYGRCEAGVFSDLDVFIVGNTTKEPDQNGEKEKLIRKLTRLDEIRLKAKLIEVSKDLKFPQFSNDGKYLQYFSDHKLIKTLGTEKDDVSNTFTARLLLILESCCLCEDEVYIGVAKNVIDQYWRDFEGHENEFIPAFFANDILRLWRTFCVNYEARTNRDSEKEKAKGKLKNYKLKHSRLMTCYSAIIYLLAVYRKRQTVNQGDAFNLFKSHPIGRLEALVEEGLMFGADALISDMIDKYGVFLDKTNRKEDGLIDEFMDKKKASDLMDEWKKFGEATFKVVNKIGDENAFHRMILV